MNGNDRADFPPIQFLTVGEEEYALIPMRLLKAVDDLAELEDELPAARALREHEPSEPGIPAEVVHAIVKGGHPVRAWREYRGLTHEELARRTGTSKAYISHIERGMCQPALALTKALSSALDAPLDALVEAIMEYGQDAPGG